MTGKFSLIVILSLIYFIKHALLKERTNSVSYWILLGFSGLSWNFINLASPNQYFGEFGSRLSINILGCVSLFLIFHKQKSKSKFKLEKNLLLSILCITILSLVNPYNLLPKALLPPLLYSIQFIIFIYLVKKSCSPGMLIKSVYEAISCWVIIEFILVLCYPILGIDAVTSFFNGNVAEEWSLRREGYPSAVGTFVHPGGLALTTSCYAIFFFSVYLSNYRKIESLLYLLACIFIVFFTYSRTSYVALTISFLMMNVLYQSDRKRIWKTFALASIVSIVFFFICFVILTFVPSIADLFLKSDAEYQTNNRLVHYTLGWEIFNKYPLLGTGINNHVNYMNKYCSTKDLVGYNVEFFLASPIHNAHLIVLVETGLIGFTFYVLLHLQMVKNLLKSFFINGVGYTYAFLIVGLLVLVFTYGFWGWSIYNYSVLTPFASLIMFMWGNPYLKIKR